MPHPAAARGSVVVPQQRRVDVVHRRQQVHVRQRRQRGQPALLLGRAEACGAAGGPAGGWARRGGGDPGASAAPLLRHGRRHGAQRPAALGARQLPRQGAASACPARTRAVDVVHQHVQPPVGGLRRQRGQQLLRARRAHGAVRERVQRGGQHLRAAEAGRVRAQEDGRRGAGGGARPCSQGAGPHLLGGGAGLVARDRDDAAVREGAAGKVLQQAALGAEAVEEQAEALPAIGGERGRQAGSAGSAPMRIGGARPPGGRGRAAAGAPRT